MQAQTKQEWANVVKKDIEELNTKANKLSNLKAKKYKIISVSFILLAIGLLIFGLIFHQKIAEILEISSKYKIICYLIAGIILLLSILITIVWNSIYWKRKEILKQLNLETYYASALNEISNQTYTLSSLKKEFDLRPQNFLPGHGEERTDQVLNITSKGTKFSFGTITNKVVTRTSKATIITYTRYRYLTINLLKESELVATIKKAGLLKIFKSKNNITLESTEFNKIFSVVANNQILIRKLLAPKILANLIDKANNESQIPAIEFKNQSVTISWPGFIVNDWKSPKEAIAELKFFGNNKKSLADILCQKITDDINLFLNCLTWFDTYEAL